ncbi:MAG TPA: hypothetical protein VF756_24820 [Thermoanaerobaculia bacterium]
MDSGICEFCKNNIPVTEERCPHCGRVGKAPNVKAAEAESEKQALDERYQASLWDADGRRCRDVVDAFEAAAAGSQAVINCRLEVLERLASWDGEIYASFYQRLEGGIQLPYGDRWDHLRQLADAALFPLYFRQIRFAALSLDGVGVKSYGPCSVALKEELIAHRSSVFEDNAAVFLRDRGYQVPAGSRAVWRERSKLCVAKLAFRLQANTRPDEFAALLLEQGATPEHDRFVEVHVWGPLTVRTFERVTLSLPGRPGQAFRKALLTRLGAVGVGLEIR